MPSGWIITAQIETKNGEWEGSIQVPTFHISNAIHGISDDNNAIAIAKEIVNPLGLIDDESIHIYAHPFD